MLLVIQIVDHVLEAFPSFVGLAVLVSPDNHNGGKDAEGIAVLIAAEMGGKPESKRVAASEHCHADAPAECERN